MVALLGCSPPGYKEIADYFKKMAEELEAKPEEYGCEDDLYPFHLATASPRPKL